MVVYKISNTINDKLYIGQTTLDFESRWSKHKLNSKRNINNKLYNAMRKHGIENFTIEPLAYCDNIHDLNFLEEAFIKKFDTVNTGYNILAGGYNRKHAQETKDKLSKANKGKVFRKDFTCSDETRLKLSKHMIGKPSLRLGVKLSQETKDKLSKANKGNPGYWKGKTLTEEHKIKLSESHKGKKLTEEHKAKIGEKSKGRHHSEETKEKMRIKANSRKRIS